MKDLAKDCDALISAYREIDRLRAGVVELKAYIRSIETMALNHGTVPQKSIQVVDLIGDVHALQVRCCHYDSGGTPEGVQDKDSVSII